jgi:opacity protein-like surface antigen
MKTPRLRTALLGSGAAIALLVATGPVAADEIDDLRAQINALQEQVTQIQADETAKPRVAPAAAVNAGSKPKSFQLPGTNTSLQIGGYAKLDLIYDFNDFNGDSKGNGAPEGSPAANKQGAFRLHARQSRLFVKTWTPTDWGELATHIEGDFYGAGGNEAVSNSDTWRARQLYGRLGPVLAGQTWSTYVDLRAYPETIDFSGATGSRFLRQSVLRYSHNMGDGAAVHLALENPDAGGMTDVVIGAATGPFVGGQLIPPSQSGVVDHMPDFVLRADKGFSGGHISGMFVGRMISFDNGGGGPALLPAFSDSAFGYSVGISGSYALTPNDTVKASFQYGDGGGKYINGVDTLFNSFVIALPTGAAAPKLRTVSALGGVVSLRHKWNATTRSNIVYGYSDVNVEDEISAVPGFLTAKGNIPAGTPDRRNSIHANLIWSPVPQVNIGLEYIWQHTSRHNSNASKVSRINIGMQYKF